MRRDAQITPQTAVHLHVEPGLHRVASPHKRRSEDRNFVRLRRFPPTAAPVNDKRLTALQFVHPDSTSPRTKSAVSAPRTEAGNAAQAKIRGHVALTAAKGEYMRKRKLRDRRPDVVVDDLGWWAHDSLHAR